jgi:predicted DNA-binding transcriptional regulator AlpA
MAEPQTPDQPAPAEDKLFTLSEISQRTGISMPTLQRYKKTYQGRLPSVGAGRKQRYPERALPVFEEIRSENAGRRGRPRKNAAAAPRTSPRTPAKPGRRPRRAGRRGAAAAPAGRRRRAAAGAGRRAGRPPGRPAGRPVGRPAGPAARRRPGRPPGAAARRGRPPGRAAAARRGRPPGPRRVGRPPGRPPGGGRRTATPRTPRKSANGRRKTAGLLTLTEISRTTGISYPTLVRYVRLYSRRLPHAGQGRARRFYPEAVEVFRSLRQESGRGGRRPKGAAGPGPGRRRGAVAARRGRPPKAAAAGAGRLEAMLVERVRDLERFKKAVEKQFGDLVKGLKRLR